MLKTWPNKELTFPWLLTFCAYIKTSLNFVTYFNINRKGALLEDTLNLITILVSMERWPPYVLRIHW